MKIKLGLGVDPLMIKRGSGVNPVTIMWGSELDQLKIRSRKPKSCKNNTVSVTRNVCMKKFNVMITFLGIH